MKMITTTGVVKHITIQLIVEKKKFGGVVVREVRMYQDARYKSMRPRKMKMMREMVTKNIALTSNNKDAIVANNLDIP